MPLVLAGLSLAHMELPLAELTCITGRTLTSPLKGDLAGLGDPLQLTEQGELSVSEAPGLICSGSQALAALDTYMQVRHMQAHSTLGARAYACCSKTASTCFRVQKDILAVHTCPPLAFGCKRTCLPHIDAPHLLLTLRHCTLTTAGGCTHP